MIQIENLSKVFRTSEVETIALNHVNIEVKEGEFVAIMGPSGCGKSTLLNILGLLDNPSEGSYKLIGKEVANLKEKERTRLRKGVIGFVFQSFNLIDELNVFENVELPLTYLGIKASERKERVLEILKRMNLSHRAKHFPQQLSGGQQQRVAIAPSGRRTWTSRSSCSATTPWVWSTRSRAAPPTTGPSAWRWTAPRTLRPLPPRTGSPASRWGTRITWTRRWTVFWAHRAAVC